MKADWANLEGHAVNGVFPLLRLLGSSERSAVFLSRTATDPPSDVALKLVPAIAGRAELLLPRWRSATALEHPHLLRLFEAGEWEIGGQRYLYAVMEYAEQNLAQLLERRALEPDEVREMLGPTLAALAFLHSSQRVHGGLKPSNVLVVGEQIKLASDAIGPASEIVKNGSGNGAALSPYQAPETQGSARSTASDIWALGVVTCEALSCRRPAGLHAMGGGIALPADIPATFAEMISKCLSRKPEDRPDVASLQAWQAGGSLESAPAPKLEAGTDDVPESTASTATRLVIRAKLIPQEELSEPAEMKAQWRPVPLMIAALVLVALVATGIYFVTSRGETPPLANDPVVAPRVVAEAPVPTPPAREAPPPPADSHSATKEVLPTVSRSARETIRGTVRVAVRVIVDQDGNVVAVTSDNPGPSRYFERLSLQAAKKWTFAPAESAEKRVVLVKFNYTRSGVTAKASPIR